METKQMQKKTQVLFKEFLEDKGLISHQIDAFNNFVYSTLQDIVNANSPIILDNCRIDFGRIYVTSPFLLTNANNIRKVYPNECRNDQSNYEGEMLLNIKITKNNKSIDYPQVCIGKLPIMLRSKLCNIRVDKEHKHKECEYDPGGYFIIRGKERALIGQLRPMYNKVYVYNSIDKTLFTAEFRSTNVLGTSVSIQAKIDSKKDIFFSLPQIMDELPPGIVFKALGLPWATVKSYLFIPENFCIRIKDDFNKLSIDEANERVFKSMQKKDKLADRDIFCHLYKKTPLDTLSHLCYILKKLIEVYSGISKTTDKDNLANKRLDSTGALLAFVVSGLFKQFVKNITNELLAKKNPNILHVIKASCKFTNKINTCFMTGKWEVVKSHSYVREGVSQVISRQNYTAFISYMRRVALPINNKGKITKMRQLHQSHSFFFCPFETPEGPQVGIITNLALSVILGLHVPFINVYKAVILYSEWDFGPQAKFLVFINGIIIGSVEDETDFFLFFDENRKCERINPTVSIVILKDVKEIHINSDHGRLLRPVFSLSDNKLLWNGESYKEAIDNYTIVYRDTWELEQSVVAMYPDDLKRFKCDYMEISPQIAMFGIMSIGIPFINHSQSPRNAYQACMGKQAIGIPSLVYNYRSDTTLHTLDYPQAPITRPEAVNILNLASLPSGSMPIVAILSFTGFNQEDSIIINKASIDRGMFASTTYKTIIDSLHKKGNSDFETICMPDSAIRRREYNYSHLNSQGIIAKTGIAVKKGDVIIGKTLTKNIKPDKKDLDKKKETEVLDISITIKANEEGIVHEITRTLEFVKIKIRISRIPQIGDKFASSCAQKGTCGMIYAQEDMPFDKNGITPDIIMNPHAIPSRMTINMLYEMAYNKITCEGGERFDASAYNEDTDKIIKDVFDSSLKTTMYNPFTGEKIQAKVFIAPAFYQKLKHMVSDKIHSRRNGPLDSLTHQPVAGRSKIGGLKVGEMERDNLISQGSSKILQEALFIQSDPFCISVCNKCNTITPNCQKCQHSQSYEINIPYATKLFFNYLQARGISIKYK